MIFRQYFSHNDQQGQQQFFDSIVGQVTKRTMSADEVGLFVEYETSPVILCTCIQCPECQGNGFHRVPTRGYPEYDLETCDECRGSGFSEVCQNCEEYVRSWASELA